MRTADEDARYDPEGHYAALGVGREASTAQIRAAYRELVRRYHPDQSAEPDAAERFRRIQAAYEVLRDPLRRMAYDNAWRTRSGEPPAGSEPDVLDTAPEPMSSRRLGARIACGIAVLATLALFLVGTALWFALGQVARLEEELAARITVAAGRTTGAVGDVGRPGKPASAASLYETVLRFEAGSAELDEPLAKRLAEAARAIVRVLEEVPDGRRWVLIVEATAPRAASAGGVVVEDWELALLRAAAVVDRLVAAGMPPERLAARFQAGLGVSGATAAELGSVRLELVCCAGATRPDR